MENVFYPAAGFNPVAPAHNNNHHGDINFTPLFRLLDDFGRYSGSHSNSRPGARAAPPTFQPKFDVRETSAAYELHGELPGAQRENIHLEFTDPQTLQVRGRIERLHTSSNDNAKAKAITEASEEASEEDKTVKDDSSTTSESGDETEKSGRGTPPLRATVQDEAEAEAEEQGTEVLNTPTTSVAAPASNNNNSNSNNGNGNNGNGNNNNSYHATSFVVPCIPTKKAAIKYWVTERSIGEFTRNFSFPARVEQDGVSANLKDGILTVVIPKSKKHQARRIVVA